MSEESHGLHCEFVEDEVVWNSTDCGESSGGPGSETKQSELSLGTLPHIYFFFVKNWLDNTNHVLIGPTGAATSRNCETATHP